MKSWRQYLKRKKRTKKTKGASPSTWKKQVGIGVLLTILIGLLGTAIWYGSRVEQLTITTVTVTGGETISHDVVERITRESLRGSYYRLVPRVFAWTYPERAITARLERLERIKTVEVERVSGTALQVTFSEYIPVALWCATECWFMDRSGVAFAAAPNLTGSSFIRYGDARPALARLEQVYKEDYLERTQRFATEIQNQLNFNVIAIERTATTTIDYQLAGRGVIKTSLDIAADTTFANLVTVLQSAEFAHLTPSNFQYIDLRFGNKVFVNEEFSTTTASITVAE